MVDFNRLPTKLMSNNPIIRIESFCEKYEFNKIRVFQKV